MKLAERYQQHTCSRRITPFLKRDTMGRSKANTELGFFLQWSEDCRFRVSANGNYDYLKGESLFKLLKLQLTNKKEFTVCYTKHCKLLIYLQ